MANPKNPVMFVYENRGYKTPCWIWQRGRNANDYGIRAKRAKYGNSKLVHVQFWVMINGPVPEGRELDHLCKNPSCVRPDHLEPVIHAVNLQRGNGARLTPEIIAEIRRRKTLGHSNRKLAAAFGINRSHASRICSQQVWPETGDEDE